MSSLRFPRSRIEVSAVQVLRILVAAVHSRHAEGIHHPELDHLDVAGLEVGGGDATRDAGPVLGGAARRSHRG
jgi:hypothetical protein